MRYPFTSVSERDVLDVAAMSDQRKSLRESLGIPYKNMVLGVGKPVHRKGFDLLIRAAASFAQDTGVYIIGGNPPIEWLDLVHQNGLKNIHFIPFCDHDSLTDYYTAADVFVLPTREDVWGLVVNEAMARGVPVITTDGCVAGCEMIRSGENGYLIPVDTWEPIVAYVNRLLTDEKHRNRIAEEGLKTVRGYTVEAMARVHAEIFEQT
ncbi:D-inositol-3-phosphate glycosyltransferase [bioreactor metagenome]|uniref:D-inositol-3-phosphate glycosyltransferase n=1 Tax=bioreactor metagenome TaxID=1076179 RepID=A0A645G2H8_9ZZZZ